jgi:hypothetical protein
MQTRMVLGLVVVWLVLNGGSVWGYSEGYYNNFFGSYAGDSNTTGWYNTFIGAFAGYSDTIGENNTFVGDSAGINNTEGNDNTFLGQGTGFHNTTGDSNTFVGFNSGGNNHDGYSNTFVGRNAGIFNDNGYDNTYIGRGAGYWNTSGSGNVFLGYSAGSDETGSDKLYIDNCNTSTPLIYGEFNTNKLTINGVFSIASSREYKRDIDPLKVEKAIEALQNLTPVEFSYKVTPSERHMGFISEEVPESLTTRDRKAVNPVDILAVLTKVLQEQQRVMQKQQKTISTLREELNELKDKVR